MSLRGNIPIPAWNDGYCERAGMNKTKYDPGLGHCRNPQYPPALPYKLPLLEDTFYQPQPSSSGCCSSGCGLGGIMRDLGEGVDITETFFGCTCRINVVAFVVLLIALLIALSYR